MSDEEGKGSGLVAGEGQTLPRAETAPDCALIFLDRAGVVTYVSPAAASLMGHPSDELMGRSFFSVGSQDDLFRCAIEGEVLVDRRIDLKRGNAVSPVLRVNLIPFRDAAEVRGIACVLRVPGGKEFCCPVPEGAGTMALVLQGEQLVFASPSLCELTGRALEELLSMAFLDLVYADDRPAVEEGLSMCWRSGEAPLRCRFRIMAREGGVRWLDAAFSVWTWEGRPAAAAVAFDVTARQAREELLLEREKHYQSLFESIAETIACDELVLGENGEPVDWRVLDVNAAYEKTFHLQREEVVGQLASRIYGAEAVRKFLPVFRQVVDLNRSVRFDYPMPERNRHFIVSTYPMGGLRFGTIGLDVTAHRTAEMERERLMGELEATINAMADGVVIYGPGGEIVRMNPVARDLLGYSEEEIREPLSRRLSRLRIEAPTGEPFPLEETLQRVFNGETIRGAMLVLHTRDGRKHWVSVSAAPVFTLDGRMIGAVGIAADISRLRELQEDREIYLHTISHDLRTPLTVVEGHAQLLKLRHQEGNDNVEESIDAILKGTQRMADMIDTLVDTAFLESGQLQLKKEPVHLPTFVAELLHRSEMVLQPERIALDIPADLPPLPADPSRLERILVNLLSNALKYGSEGGTVHLEVRREGEEIRISVHDRGPGIDPEDLPHIFTRFYRTKRARKGKGIGLGLYISRLLTEAHGGRIWATSVPGQGCVFSLALPLH